MANDIFFDEATHTYLVDGVEMPSVTEILKPLHRSYAKVNPSVLEYAKNRGKAVHEALELVDYGADPEVSPEIIGYLNAYQEWAQIYKPNWTGVEQIVYSEDEGFIRTLDRIGTLNGTEFALVDIKTSYPTKEALVSVCCQTFAYAMAYTEQSGKADKYVANIHRYGLFLKADGSYRLVDCEAYENKYGFSGALVFCELMAMHRTITRILETKERGK